ncbi:ABC transporter ATP-binding protein [Nocardioides sp. L-11A]|uniref:ABC transporter ATP-binding protein n=1 Tax=Nocardioides sp. L-11A TaxID=3043848 RepID=UPI00249CCA2A|nr:ABC transporter ATP-binding protein [Nocardioides sp. L-11A]
MAPATGADVPPAIAVRAATKVFGVRGRDTVHAVDPVDLTIEKGEFVALLGPSGCGKSTLLSMIAGLTPATTGDVVVDGRAVAAPLTDLGFVFQKDLLLPWRDVLSNVLVQFEMRGERTDRHRETALGLLRSVGLEGMERRLPHELSGGMRQRVAICRALVHDPPLLLLDEPLGALDALTRDQLRIDIQRIWSRDRKTAVLVTHDIEEAVFLAQRVIVMTPRPGRIHADIPIELPFPRRLEVKETPEFLGYVRTIREQFEALGVIHED